MDSWWPRWSCWNDLVPKKSEAHDAVETIAVKWPAISETKNMIKTEGHLFERKSKTRCNEDVPRLNLSATPSHDGTAGPSPAFSFFPSRVSHWNLKSYWTFFVWFVPCCSYLQPAKKRSQLPSIPSMLVDQIGRPPRNWKFLRTFGCSDGPGIFFGGSLLGKEVQNLGSWRICDLVSLLFYETCEQHISHRENSRNRKHVRDGHSLSVIVQTWGQR